MFNEACLYIKHKYRLGVHIQAYLSDVPLIPMAYEGLVPSNYFFLPLQLNVTNIWNKIYIQKNFLWFLG